MRNRQRQVKEKRLVVAAFDPIERFVQDDVVRILVALGRPAAAKAPVSAGHALDGVFQRSLFPAAPEELWVIVMRMHLVEIAKEGPESLLERMALIFDFAQPPLAEQRCRITGVPQ